VWGFGGGVWLGLLVGVGCLLGWEVEGSLEARPLSQAFRASPSQISPRNLQLSLLSSPQFSSNSAVRLIK